MPFAHPRACASAQVYMQWPVPCPRRAMNSASAIGGIPDRDNGNSRIGVSAASGSSASSPSSFTLTLKTQFTSLYVKEDAVSILFTLLSQSIELHVMESAASSLSLLQFFL